MSALSTLNLAGNRINIIPDDALDRLNLTRGGDGRFILLMRHNELEELPNLHGSWFYSIYASENNLDLEEGDFEDATIKFFDISENKISDLSPLLEISKLEHLSVKNNPLGNLSSADLYNLIQSQPDLTILYVDSCNLTTMPDIRNLLKEDFDLTMLDNPWICDCRISWMENTTDIGFTTLKCAAPSRHAGKLLHGIPLEDYCPGELVNQYSILNACKELKLVKTKTVHT
jgi:Leucine-rich repeat (LRR) protein